MGELMKIYQRQRAGSESHSALGDTETLRARLQSLWRVQTSHYVVLLLSHTSQYPLYIKSYIFVPVYLCVSGDFRSNGG